MARQRSFRITAVYDRLLRGSTATPVGLYQLGLATAAQLTRLHYSPASLTHVKEQLKTLRDHGYVQSGTIPTTHHGTPFYYTLGPEAIRYLARLGYDLGEPSRASREVDKSWLFLKHRLELNDVVISAALLQGATTLGSFATDRTLKRKPLIVTMAPGKTMLLVPDAVLGFRLGEERTRILIEHDRGTEGQAHFRRRIRAYVAYLRTERLPVAFTTFEGERRRDQMRHWTKSELNELNEAALPFYFAAFARPPGPEDWLSPIWYTPYDVPPQSLLGA